MKPLILSLLLLFPIPAYPDLWEAIVWRESRGQVDAFNPAEKAAGIIQIRPCVIADLNRVAGCERWILDDRWCPAKSWMIFREYTGHWITRFGLEDTPENRARIFNGGPRGYRKTSTVEYWRSVEERI